MTEFSTASSKKKFLPKIILPVLLFLALSIAAYFFYRYQQVSQNDSGELDQLIKELSSIIELPSGEVPTLATVSDRNKLLNQPFFAKAENGDKVLIYIQAGKAILYRPSTGKIVDTAPISKENTSPETLGETASPTLTPAPSPTFSPLLSPSPIPSPSLTEKETIKDPLTIALYNGTEITGVTVSIANSLTSEFNFVEIKNRDSANSKSYSRTLLINLSQFDEKIIQEIAEFLDAEITELPADELETETDLLIIIGQDQT